MGLDDGYGTLRTRIINMDPLPNLNRVYAIVMQIESERGITNSRDEPPARDFYAHNDRPAMGRASVYTGSSMLGVANRTPSGRP